jgi:hypothetical protein
MGRNNRSTLFIVIAEIYERGTRGEQRGLYIKHCRYETLSENAKVFGNHGANRDGQEILTLDVESK